MKEKNTKLYNVSFGILILLPPGWLIILLTLFIESLIISKLLKKQYYDKRIYLVVIASNLISGAIGFIGSLFLNGGWWLVTWFPWVSNNEVRSPHLQEFVIYFAVAILLTFITEIIINILFLKKLYSIKSITKASILANIVTNFTIVSLMYTYSFGIMAQTNY